MARQEEPREDLLREATALVERAELRIPSHGEPIVVGFRRDGAASFFFGQDPVFQFNSAGELRRAFCDGKMIKAECGQLVQLTRHRTASEVQLVRHELNADETNSLLASAKKYLIQLQSDLGAARFELIGQVPPGGDVVGKVNGWLAELPGQIPVANSPRAI